MINADFCCAAILITFGALLGKVTLPQMIIIATFESFFWALNSEIIYKTLKGTDVGSTFTVHIFGATFGIVCSYFFYNEESLKNKDNKTSYESNLVAFLGTVFLFMYWPSFNSVFAVFGS